MSRIVAIGLAALTLAACGPADQKPAAGTAAPVPAATPAATAAPAAATAAAPQPTAPMTWEAMQDRYRQMEVLPTDPLEALEMRAVLCSHFAGEIGGEDPEREKFLGAQMDRYRCGDLLVAEARAMRDARAGEPAVVTRLNTILAELA